MTDISKAEFDVLNALWDIAPATAQEVIEQLNQHSDWHEKTVKTLLGRLVKKGAVGFEKADRRYIYSPCIARDNYTIKESTRLVERLFSGRIGALVAGFVKHEKLSQKDIDDLKKVIADWEKHND